jgi:hypothetical protein
VDTTYTIRGGKAGKRVAAELIVSNGQRRR